MQIGLGIGRFRFVKQEIAIFGKRDQRLGIDGIGVRNRNVFCRKYVLLLQRLLGHSFAGAVSLPKVKTFLMKPKAMNEFR